MKGKPRPTDRGFERGVHPGLRGYAALVYLATACALILLEAHWNRILFDASAASGAGAAAWRRIADWILAGP